MCKGICACTRKKIPKKKIQFLRESEINRPVDKVEDIVANQNKIDQLYDVWGKNTIS